MEKRSYGDLRIVAIKRPVTAAARTAAGTVSCRKHDSRPGGFNSKGALALRLNEGPRKTLEFETSADRLRAVFA